MPDDVIATNDALIIEIIRQNVRSEPLVLADIFSNVTCTEVGERLLLEVMEDYSLDSINLLAKVIQMQTREAMLKKFAQVTAGCRL